MLSNLRRIIWPRSLRTRLFIILMISCLIPLLVVGTVSYYTIYSIMNNKIERGIQLILGKDKISLENTLNNLDYTSKQLMSDGRIGTDIVTMLETKDPYEEVTLDKEIQKELLTIYFANPYIGLLFYYLPDESKYIYNTSNLKENFHLDKLPVLFEKGNAKYSAPHDTLMSNISFPVFSIVRQVNLPTKKINIYMETNLKSFQNLLLSEEYGIPVSHMLMDVTGRIVYSEDLSAFPLGTNYTQLATKSEYLLYSDSSAQGWKIAVALKKKDYTNEIRKSFFSLAVLGVFSIVLAIVLAMAVWRMFYRPMMNFKKEIKQLSSNYTKPLLQTSTDIMEFDELRVYFHELRQKILDLLMEVEMKEKSRNQLEVEKLMVQINPHFIHNTLNTIQWIARINGQDEIDDLVSIFTRILHYNLGKEGNIVTIHDEIENLKDYIALQTIRYDYKFDVIIRVDPDVEDYEIPRFLLQPLVENAMYHGFDEENGSIEVTVTREDLFIYIRVSDTGRGMSEEVINQLLNNDADSAKKIGFGIGLRYVVKMLNMHFGYGHNIEIISNIGKGTTMQIKLPLGDDHNESIGRR